MEEAVVQQSSGFDIVAFAQANPVLFGVAVFLLLIFLFSQFLRILRYLASLNKAVDNAIFLIKLPKDKPGDQQQGGMKNYLQQLHEEISRSEMLFASIGGLRHQESVSSWFFGRDDQFSFEIVAHNKLICFYATCPRRYSSYLEHQISAIYPEAVVELVDDYNLFGPRQHVFATWMKTKRHYIFPLKTYNKMEADPLNNILNSMSKIKEDEGLALQLMVRSSAPGWHNIAKKTVVKASQYSSVSKGLSYATGGFWTGLAEMFASAAKSKPNDPMMQKRLTPMEEETLKGVEQKNSKAGMDINMRIVVSARDRTQGSLYLHDLVNALSQFNLYQYGNSLVNRGSSLTKNRLIKDFIHRRFDDSKQFLLNTEEVTSLFHLPLKDAETPNILWLMAKHAPAPTNIPDEGIILGYNHYRGVKKEIRIKRADRRRHSYIIGKSGVGKSQLMLNMAVQDILNGEGVCVLDPHGDLIEDILCRVPPERAEDVILFAPFDLERPLALNLIEFDPRYPEQKTFVINEMIKIFDKLYDLKATGGPIFEQYMRNALLLIMADPESGSTLMEIPRVLADPEFRKMKLDRCADMTVVSFWRNEAEKAGGEAALANIVPYITSKLTSFVSNDMMRPIIGQQNSSFNVREAMDSGKILLINLSKGQVGELNAYLLGMILIGKILMAALSRTDMPEEKRKDFYLYIDEFQNFTTDSINSILSEARKYKLNMIIAHQYIGQLVKQNDTTVRDAVFGNVGTIMAFKIGSEDAQVLEKEFAPVFSQYDLINVDKFSCLTKLLIDNAASRPFSMNTPWPITGVVRKELVPKIKALSRLKYGQDRNIIEAEIRRRWRQ